MGRGQDRRGVRREVRDPPFREHDPALHGPAHRPPRKTQTRHVFIQNQAKQVWACDFLTRYTAFSSVAYTIVIMEVGSRRIVHVNATTNPTLSWVKQQIREATDWGQTPRFLIHDNDRIFGQYGRLVRVERDGRTSSYRCHLDRWLQEVVGLERLPTPFGAPNASPHVERVTRTLRNEALDHFIFLSVEHIRLVVAGFVKYKHGARPSQAIHGIPDPYPELREPPFKTGRLVALPVLGGVQHDDRLAAWAVFRPGLMGCSAETSAPRSHLSADQFQRTSPTRSKHATERPV